MNTTEHTNGTYSALEAAIAADYGSIAGMVVLKDGTPVYEAYFGGCTKDSRINVFSVTKSVVSLLIGIALDRGILKASIRRFWAFSRTTRPSGASGRSRTSRSGTCSP